MTVENFFKTDDSKSLLIQRLVLGAVIFPHGAQKLFGWFGGLGFSGTIGWFDSAVHVPAPIAVLVILGESLGALALMAGIGTRLAAAGIFATMLGAMLMVHASNGFFMNWFNNQPGEGVEYGLLALALGAPLVVRGAGALSIDGWLAKRLPAALPKRALART